MNLGDIYLRSLLVIAGLASLLAISLGCLVKLRSNRLSWAQTSLAMCLLALVLAVSSVGLFHRRVFVAWHRSQNDLLPQSGNLTYDPDFFQLLASYTITRQEFDAWVVNHPWPLKPRATTELIPHDQEAFGIASADASFQTDMTSSGKQLRVYFKSGILYVSYNSM